MILLYFKSYQKDGLLNEHSYSLKIIGGSATIRFLFRNQLDYNIVGNDKTNAEQKNGKLKQFLLVLNNMQITEQ